MKTAVTDVLRTWDVSRWRCPDRGGIPSRCCCLYSAAPGSSPGSGSRCPPAGGNGPYPGPGWGGTGPSLQHPCPSVWGSAPWLACPPDGCGSLRPPSYAWLAGRHLERTEGGGWEKTGDTDRGREKEKKRGLCHTLGLSKTFTEGQWGSENRGPCAECPYVELHHS